MFRKIEVKFIENAYGKKSDNTYVYFTDIPSELLKPGTLVVAPTRNTFSVAQFVGYTDSNRMPTRVITQLVDADHNSYVQEQLVEFIEKQKQCEDLKKELEERRKMIETKEIYRMLAEKDPVMKELLDKLEALEL